MGKDCGFRWGRRKKSIGSWRRFERFNDPFCFLSLPFGSYLFPRIEPIALDTLLPPLYKPPLAGNPCAMTAGTLRNACQDDIHAKTIIPDRLPFSRPASTAAGERRRAEHSRMASPLRDGHSARRGEA